MRERRDQVIHQIGCDGLGGWGRALASPQYFRTGGSLRSIPATRSSVWQSKYETVSLPNLFPLAIVGSLLLALCVAPSVAADSRAVSEQDVARNILTASGIQGGLIVHIGCGDGRLTAALRADESYLVHGLDTSAENVQKARKHVQAIGLYGDVSVDRFDGKRLPYVDNLVNLVVIRDAGCGVRDEEILRVLAPGGVAVTLNPQLSTVNSVRKPVPGEIDEWTHWMYDASNNAVSNDSVVGVPHRLQWIGSPKWARSHDHLASVSAVVSAGGRVFSIVDEGPTAAVVLDPKWSLIARDAFSGVVLWKRPIERWQWHLRGFRSGPSDLARRLVAVGDRVYVTLGIDAPLSALDAATGQTLTTYQGTEGTSEILHDNGTLYVVAGEGAFDEMADRAKRRGERPGFAEVRSQRPGYVLQPPSKRILVIDAETGRLVWKKSDADTTELMPTTLAVSGERLFYQNTDDVLCLNAKSGKEIWRSPRPVSRSRPTWSAPTLVVYRDVVLSADRAVAEEKTQDTNDQRKVEWIVSSAGGQAPVGEVIAFSAKDGKRLWSSKCRECYNAPVDLLVADGLVWTGELVRANEPGFTQGLDPVTGVVKRSRPKDQEFFVAGMGHQRCYRNKATNKYLVLGRSGIEFIDLATGNAIPNHWTRGTCQFGVLPCNGLLYAPPHSCACFIRSKLNGFNCFAAKQSGVQGPESRAEGRLERGPAYASSLQPSASSLQSSSWPTYRHDAARSGFTRTSIPANLQTAWRVELGGKLSSVVVADGKLFVAQIDTHTVHALSANDGQPVWSYTAGGRVDSPPTFDAGRVYFGSADGSVYCLRASDGELVWRFRAAADDRRIVAFGQVESAWPVHGSVLVQDGVVCCAAGRSSYLEGSIRLCRLDAQTGQLLSETIVDHRDPETGHQRKGSVKGTNMPGALPDVLSRDGDSLHMRHTRFDLKGELQEPDPKHLFSAAGFLDDSWWHRTYWMLGTLMTTNYGGWPRIGSQVPAGRLLVLDDSTVYGFGRNQYIHHGAHVGIDGATVYHFRAERDNDHRFTNYQAFAIDRNAPVADAKPKKAQAQAKRRRKAPARPKQYRWTQALPILARAMVLAEKNLFIAGPPDFMATDDPVGALEGRQGGSLIAISTADGREVGKCRLDSPPVWDGMAATRGRLYLASMDGAVSCFSKSEQKAK